MAQHFDIKTDALFKRFDDRALANANKKNERLAKVRPPLRAFNVR